ncbi:MAG: ATP-binding protein [Coriobacteriia bacterium]|nr:ATP-binding protein [Coriobacteriia bacterium]
MNDPKQNTSAAQNIAQDAGQDEELKELLAIFGALSNAYSNVYLIHAKSEKVKVLKLNGYVTTGVQKNSDILYDYSTLQKQYVSERVHPDDRDAMNEAIELTRVKSELKTEAEYSGNYRVLENGEVHYYQFKYVRPENIDYIVAGFQNTDDIVARHLEQERKRHELEEAHQRELEEQLAIFDVLSRNYRNVYKANINDGSSEILKLSDDYDLEKLFELKNRVFPYESVLDFWITNRVHPEDKERVKKQLSAENLRKVLSSQDEYTGTYRSLDNGTMRNYQFFVAKMDDEGTVIAGFRIIDDIIEEHLEQEREQREKEEAYQRKLIAAKQDAERANRAKTDFLLRMSHDIRTPLNGIMDMLDIAERCGDDILKRDDCRMKIKESAQVLLEIINEVLDMNKLESGKVTLEHVPFDMVEVSRTTYNVIAKQAEKHGIEIVQLNCSTPHRKLIGSPVHYKRIVTNVLSNAIKYNKENGKIYITCRELSCNGDTVTIQFICRDTGIGMSEEFLQHLFDPFSQENEAPRSEYGGTGLGMSIVKNIVDAMGGTLSVESEKGIGTTFEVAVPFEIDKSEPADNPTPETKEEASIKGLKILVAEDNGLNMEINEFLLGEEGAQVVKASNGQEAVKVFLESEPFEIDAILMDIMMPKMSGLDATREIRRAKRPDAAKVPIIAMTASAFAEDRIAAKEAGMNDHLAKPLESRLVIQTISKCASAYRAIKPKTS